MTRKILCPICLDDCKKRFGNSLEPFTGEYLKYVDGRAMRPYKCDHCGEKIKALEWCCAYSISARNTPYFSWEHEYIIVKKGFIIRKWRIK